LQPLCLTNWPENDKTRKEHNCHRAGEIVRVLTGDKWEKLPDSCIVPVKPVMSPCTRAYKLGQKITKVFTRVMANKVHEWAATAESKTAGFKDAEGDEWNDGEKLGDGKNWNDEHENLVGENDTKDTHIQKKLEDAIAADVAEKNKDKTDDITTHQHDLSKCLREQLQAGGFTIEKVCLYRSLNNVFLNMEELETAAKKFYSGDSGIGFTCVDKLGDNEGDDGGSEIHGVGKQDSLPGAGSAKDILAQRIRSCTMEIQSMQAATEAKRKEVDDRLNNLKNLTRHHDDAVGEDDGVANNEDKSTIEVGSDNKVIN